MKKSKQILTLVLALALCVGLLAGCGGKKSESEPAVTDDPGSSNTTPGNVTPDGFVYAADYTPVSGTFNNGMENTYFANDGIYTTSYEVVADNTPADVVPEWEGQYWEYGMVLYRISYDGNEVTKLDFKPTQIPEGMQGSSNVQTMTVGSDGNLYLLENLYTWSTEGMPEDIELYSDEYWENYEQYYTSEESYQVRVVDSTGADVRTIKLDNLAGEGEYFYPYSFVMDAQGNIYIPSDTYLYVLSGEGELLFRIEVENWIENAVCLKDGKVYGLYYGSSGYTMAPVDLEAKAFGEAVTLPPNVYNIITGGGDYDFYYTNGVNFYGYDMAKGEAAKILNWISCDVDNNNAGRISVLDDGRICMINNNWDEKGNTTTCEIVTISKKPADSVPQKTILTLATQYLQYNVRSAIIQFNKSNDKYRIEVQDYSEYNTEEDYSAGLTKLTTELLSGKIPDIIDLNGVPLTQLAGKGYLEDLYPYLESDSALSRDSMFPNVLSAAEIDGKLYTTLSTFSINTVIGAASVVGDKIGWTVSDFKAALASMPEGCTAFNQYLTRPDILATCLNLDMDTFVDWTTGKVDFNNEGFTELLEFAGSFPSEFDWENYEWSEEDDDTSRITSGKQMLMQMSIYDFEELQLYKAIFGGDITFVGYPTAYGTGNTFEIGSGYAMSSKCSNKDGAWEFLRQFFTEEYQTGRYGWQFPVNKEAFDKKLKEAMTVEYEKDEKGNFILDENGEKIPVDRGTWGWGSIEVKMTATTQEDADEIMELINTTTKVSRVDQSITDIVAEEAEAYFSGQKSAQEVARLVQSKVNLYVNEHR